MYSAVASSGGGAQSRIAQCLAPTCAQVRGPPSAGRSSVLFDPCNPTRTGFGPQLANAPPRHPRGEVAADDDGLRRHDVDRMDQRIAHKIAVDERHHRADARQPEPDRHVVGAVGHQQTHGVPRTQALAHPPARILIAAKAEFAIAQRCLGRHQRGRRAELGRQPVDQYRQDNALLVDGGGSLQGTDPCLAGDFRIRFRGLRHRNCEPYHDYRRCSSYTGRTFLTTRTQQ